MKKVIYPLAIALLLPAACIKNYSQKDLEDGHKVEVTVTIRQDAGSRASGTTYSEESRVNSLQVFAFNGNALEDYKYVTSSLTATLAATSGEREIWAVVNAPLLSDVTSLTELKSKVSYLSDNAPDNLVMVGSAKDGLRDGGVVHIDVKRLASRCSIGKISSAFHHALSNAQVAIDAVYIINATAGISYDLSSFPSSWINELGHNDSDHDNILFDAVTGVTVTNTASYTKEHAFYPYPNPSSTHTMLVIEVTFHENESDITGTKGYYPIKLPAIERNKTYIIEEVILSRRPGSVPYEPIETGEASVEISVHDWEIGLNLGTITI